MENETNQNLPPANIVPEKPRKLWPYIFLTLAVLGVLASILYSPESRINSEKITNTIQDKNKTDNEPTNLFSYRSGVVLIKMKPEATPDSAAKLLSDYNLKPEGEIVWTSNYELPPVRAPLEFNNAYSPSKEEFVDVVKNLRKANFITTLELEQGKSPEDYYDWIGDPAKINLLVSFSQNGFDDFVTELESYEPKVTVVPKELLSFKSYFDYKGAYIPDDASIDRNGFFKFGNASYNSRHLLGKNEARLVFGNKQEIIQLKKMLNDEFLRVNSIYLSSSPIKPSGTKLSAEIELDKQLPYNPKRYLEEKYPLFTLIFKDNSYTLEIMTHVQPGTEEDNIKKLKTSNLVSYASKIWLNALPSSPASADPGKIREYKGTGVKAAVNELVVLFGLDFPDANSRIREIAQDTGANIAGSVIYTNTFQLQWNDIDDFEALGQMQKRIEKMQDVESVSMSILGEHF